MDSKPKYQIDDLVWMIGINTICEHVVYGVFPISKVYRELPRGRVADDEMTEEDFKAWGAIHPDKRLLSFKVVGWYYLIAKEVTEAHMCCSRFSEKPKGEVWSELYNLVEESKLFPSKEALIKSI